MSEPRTSAALDERAGATATIEPSFKERCGSVATRMWLRRASAGAVLTLMVSCATWRALPDPPLEQVEALSAQADAMLALTGPDGALPAARSEQVTRRLAALGEYTLLDRQLIAMERLGASPLIAGNRVALLVDGPQTYREIFAAVDAARDHVNIETYIFDEALTDGRRLTEVLGAAVARGVAVNVLYDAVGSLSTDERVFETLRAAGVTLCPFNPLDPGENETGRYVQRTHRKIVVADARVAFAGGLNFSSEYASSSRSIIRRKRPTVEQGWRDTHLRIEGPAVQQMQELYLQSWSRQRCPQPREASYQREALDAGDTLLRLVASSVDSRFGETYLNALSAVTYAQRSIDVTMAYFAPDDRLQRALEDAARRGVRVRMLLPGISDFQGLVHAARAHYQALLDAGVQIYEEHRAFVHAKTLVVDGIWSTVGSANWDYRSFSDNDELNVVVIDTGFAAQMARLFERDLAGARTITAESWAERPWKDRLLQRFWVLWERWL